MARPSRRYILELLEEFDPAIREAFLDAVYALRADADLHRIVERLERNDIEGALRAVNIDAAAFRTIDRTIMNAFEAGGRATIGRLPLLREPSGGRVVVRFDIRNPRAEYWLANHSTALARELEADQIAAARSMLTTGMARGDGPRTVALNLIGRINKATGLREGGVLGLTSNQEAWLRAYSEELSDPARLEKALGRKLRDRRFDRSILKAIREGKAIPAEIRAKMVTAYSNRALRYRAEMLARTEAMTALNSSQEEAFQQAIDSGKVDPEAVTRIWHTAADERVRHSHAKMQGQTVGFYESFTAPSGARLRYPGDPLAPADERIGCRCWMEFRIDFLRGVK